MFVVALLHESFLSNKHLRHLAWNRIGFSTADTDKNALVGLIPIFEIRLDGVTETVNSYKWKTSNWPPQKQERRKEKKRAVKHKKSLITVSFMKTPKFTFIIKMTCLRIRIWHHIMWSMTACVCVSQPYYVDEDDFFKACDHKQLLVIDRYLSTGGDMDACDAVSHQHSTCFDLFRLKSSQYIHFINRRRRAESQTSILPSLCLSSYLSSCLSVCPPVCLPPPSDWAI